MLAALAHAAVLSEVPHVPASQLTARLEEVHVLSCNSADIGNHGLFMLFMNEGLW